ncbi:hypothetical protein [Shewanella sp. 1180_01]|uniref:hypothetical protein n=1 Tax=Shewanella sp. 1180_01 TaxID=2604451 RepID=UPI00406323BD
MKKIVFLILLSIFSTGLFAECAGHQCSNVKITRMYISPSGDTIISTSGDESKLSCDAGTSGYLSMAVEQKNYNATYSLILMAHSTGHPIAIRTTESGSCKIQYVVSDK